MYVHVGDIHRVTPCVIVRYTDYVCKTQNLFYELHRYIILDICTYNLSNRAITSSSYACFWSSLRKESFMSCCHLGNTL